MTFIEKEEFKKPELRKLIVELKNEGNGWKFIVEEVMRNFNIKITPVSVKKIYEKEIAKAITSSPKQRDKFRADYSDVGIRYKRVEEHLDRLLDNVDGIYKRDGELSIPAFIKMAPVIISVCREVINQLTFIRQEQQKIIFNQKNLIYSPIQMNIAVNSILKKLEKEGKIQIIKEIRKAGDRF